MQIPFTELWRARREEAIARARFEAGRYQALSSSFTASRRTRLRPGPRPAGGSGQAHRDRRTRDNLRRDCQDAYRNNLIAQAIIDRKVEMVVGRGPRLRVESPDPDFNRRAEDLFWEWAGGSRGGCDITGRYTFEEILEQAVAAPHTDGRLLLLKVKGRGGQGVLQVIEDERVRNPFNRLDDDRMVAGVELDELGRPRLYHVADWERDGAYASSKTTAYDARYVIEVRNPQCRVPGVVAPEPVIASILEWLELLEDSAQATAIAYRIATLFGFIQYSDTPAGDQAALIAGTNSGTAYDASADDDDPAGYAIQAGTGWHLKTGGKVEQLKPEHPATGVDRFAWMLVQLCAARVGLPIDLTHFVMDRNWSGTRSRMAVAWRAVHAWQRMLCGVCERVSRWKVAEWMNAGLLESVPEWYRHTWVPAPMPILDPGQEIKTRRDAIEGRLMDYQTAFDDLDGGDWPKMAERLAAQIAALRDAGIEPVVAGAAPGAQAGDQTPQGTPENVGA